MFYHRNLGKPDAMNNKRNLLQNRTTSAPVSSTEEVEWRPDPAIVKAWLVEPRLNASAPCPLGFICENDRQANCTKIRTVSLAYGFGDIHAGIYCPEGLDQMRLCPIGYYCPTANQRFKCPATYYCPFKTAVPELRCLGCGEAAKTLVRDQYGYNVLGFLLASMVCWMIVSIIRWCQRAVRLALLGDVNLDSRSFDDSDFEEQAEQMVSLVGEEFSSNPLGSNTIAQEARELFHELAHGRDRLAYEDLFGSNKLSMCLSDSQINELIIRLRKAVDASEEEKATGGGINKKKPKSGLLPLFGLGVIFHCWERFAICSASSSNEFENNTKNSKQSIDRETFVKHYPAILLQVNMEDRDEVPADDDGINECVLLPTKRGIDLAFEDLSLTVSVGDKKINVVNHVTGRLAAKSMTALIGASGAGKTSLLNALCGRAFYGETTGTIWINGHVATIGEHSSCIGFVPQDDIVHPELTVKENLVYSGKFSLPRGTSLEAIEGLAYEVLAQLGLSRVTNSIVGDVNQRGVSGGERKRVNIGLELMSRPSILFLDEPTSGLDSSSALLVISSLRNLVETQKMTVLSVIHQPRKAIFDSFDSLILLGLEGKMVFHGPITEAPIYFASLSKPYLLPQGENTADWLIDIASGQSMRKEEECSNHGDTNCCTQSIKPVRYVERRHLRHHAGENDDLQKEKAAKRRQELYDSWNFYCERMSDQQRDRFLPPIPYDLPVKVQKPTFWSQFQEQVQRNLLFAWRNRTSKLFEMTLVVGAVILISWFTGVTEVTRAEQPERSFDQLVQGGPYEIAETFPYLFKYALGPTAYSIEYAMQVGAITCVLLGLNAAKSLTSKRLTFYREAGSGWDVNAYFLALNLTSTAEHALQAMVAAGCAHWLRAPLSAWYAYQIQFLMLMWMTTSWSLLIPLVSPANNTKLAVGFFMAVFGLLCSGAIHPVTYRHDIYEDGNSGLALFSGFASVTRYFIEGMTVQDQRCLPPQSGFTIEATSINFPVEFVGSFNLAGLAQKDLSVFQRSCNGWYWGVFPAFLVGCSLRFLAAGILHVSDRPKQCKKSLWYDLKRRPLLRNKALGSVVAFILLLACMVVASGWLILAQRGDLGIMDRPTTDNQVARLFKMTIDKLPPELSVNDFPFFDLPLDQMPESWHRSKFWKETVGEFR